MFDYKPYVKSLVKYMLKNGYTKRPLPEIVLNTKKQDGVFIRTGHYEIGDNRVVLYIWGRHPKDVLRSLAHELIHHKQFLEGRLDSEVCEENHIINSEELLEYEEEAYLDGNIAFRSWTEQYK